MLKSKLNSLNFSLVGQTGEYGAGAGKLLGTKDLLKGHNELDFYAYDLTQKKLVYYNVDSLINNEYTHTDEISFDQTDLANLISIEVCKDSIFVGTVMNGSGRLVYFKGNKIIDYKGKIPSNLYNSSDYVHGHSFRADLTKFNESLVTSCFFSDLIQVYTIAGDSVAAYQGPETFWPVYNYKNRESLQTLPETKVAYVTSTSNSHSLYTLFKGDNKANVIYTFDRSMKPLSKIKVSNHKIQSIICDEKNIFCIANVDTRPQLLTMRAPNSKQDSNVVTVKQ